MTTSVRSLRVACLAVGLLAGSLAGCVGRSSAFVCETSAECVHAGNVGACEPSGYCSFDDLGCASGRRYGDLASPVLAGACVIEDHPDGDATELDATPAACPEVGVSFRSPSTGRCYARIEGLANGRAAAPLCATAGMMPAVLSGPRELDEVQAALLPPSLGATRYHVGLYARGGTFHWGDGVVPPALPWAPGEPTGNDVDDVVLFEHDPGGGAYELRVYASTATAGVLCEEPVVAIRDPSAYTIYYGRYHEQATLDETCGPPAAGLASITSDEENTFVAAAVGSVWVRIGLTDTVEEGTYVWPSGEPYGYEDWGGGEPDDPSNGSDEDCTTLVGGATPSWFDVSCAGIVDGFVCERPAP